MRKKLLTIVILGLSLHYLLAQCDCNGRFQNLSFPNYNAHTLTYAQKYNWDGSLENLNAKVYTPHNDTVSIRPLIMFLHGGAFLGGSFDTQSIRDFCQHFVQLGYTVASIQYRIGIEPPGGTFEELESMYRAVQDAKTAIRFFKSHPDTMDFRIDTSAIILGGYSAGGTTAYMAAWGEQNEYPYIDTLLFGTLSAATGNSGISENISAIFTSGALILDTLLINESGVPAAIIHGFSDPIIDYYQGNRNGFTYYGGYPIYEYLTNHSIKTDLLTISDPMFHTPLDTIFHAHCFSFYTNFFHSVIQDGQNVRLTFFNDTIKSSLHSVQYWYNTKYPDCIDTSAFLLPEYPGYYYSTGISEYGCTVSSDTIYIDTFDVSVKSQIVYLDSGWNTKSTYLHLIENEPTLVFYQTDNFHLLKDGNGKVFWRDYGVYQVTEINNSNGYQLFCTSIDSVNFKGVYFDPSDVAFSFQENWNLIGYPYKEAYSPDKIFALVLSDIISIKNNNGDIYFPAYSINNIGNLIPGEGYLIKSNSNFTFNFPNVLR